MIEKKINNKILNKKENNIYLNIYKNNIIKQWKKINDKKNMYLKKKNIIKINKNHNNINNVLIKKTFFKKKIKKFLLFFVTHFVVTLIKEIKYINWIKQYNLKKKFLITIIFIIIFIIFYFILDKLLIYILYIMRIILIK